MSKPKKEEKVVHDPKEHKKNQKKVAKVKKPAKKEKKAQEDKARPKITEKAFLAALKKAKGKNITPLYNAFDKTDFAGVEPSKLKTKLRAYGKKLAAKKKPKIKMIHEDGSRAYTYVLA